MQRSASCCDVVNLDMEHHGVFFFGLLIVPGCSRSRQYLLYHEQPAGPQVQTLNGGYVAQATDCQSRPF